MLYVVRIYVLLASDKHRPEQNLRIEVWGSEKVE